MRSNRNHDRQRLEQELGGETYTSLLRRLHETNAFLCRFGDWSDFIAFMCEGTSDGPLKEEALLAILKAHAADHDPRWQTVLLTLFWPSLDAIFNWKKRWDKDADERWQNVLWAFLETVYKMDVHHRAGHLIRRIINGTIRRLHDEYRRIWKRNERETPTAPEHFDKMAGDNGESDFDAADRRSMQDAEIKRLRTHLDAGRISEADFLLIVGTRVYGKSVAEYARENGMNGEVARKRRQRAEAHIRRAERKNEEFF